MSQILDNVRTFVICCGSYLTITTLLIDPPAFLEIKENEFNSPILVRNMQDKAQGFF
jgi:hypothetical protein